MNNTTVLLIVQSLLTSLQIINAGLATVTSNKAVILIIGAVVGGLQVAMQRVGNQTVPPPKPL